MWGAALAPWLVSGVLASVLVTVGFFAILAFFMWLDWGFARFVMFVAWAIFLVIRWLSG